MGKITLTVVTGVLLLCTSIANADAHSDGDDTTLAPVELYACSYAEGKTAKDLDAAVATWNDWADKRDVTDYSAWKLTPFYSTPEQDFDMLWLGTASSGESLGRAQDEYLAEGGKIMEKFNEVAPCAAHVNFSAMQFKAPPERDNPNNAVLAFSDCDIADEANFSDIAPRITEWASYREAQGSTSGMWVLFPAYGGGEEDFDFKVIQSYQNLEEQGVDYDQWNSEGWKKAGEIFEGTVSCDSARVYIATNLRMASDDE